MKTKLLIIIWIVLPFFGYSQLKPEDFKWEGKRNYLNNFDVSYLKSQYYTFYYRLNNYIKITSSDKKQKLSKIEFENGKVIKISDSIYCIIPEKIGRFNLALNGEAQSYKVIALPEEKIEIKFSSSNSPFPDCISFEDLMNSDFLTASFNYNNFKIRHWTIGYSGNTPDVYYGFSGQDTIYKDYKKHLKGHITLNSEIDFRGTRVYLYDTSVYAAPHSYKVVDSYQNEYIRRTLKISPETNNLNLLKNDLRIKISGCTRKEFNEAANDMVNELNGMLETIKLKLVDRQPTLTIKIDTIVEKVGLDKEIIDSQLIAQGGKSGQIDHLIPN